MDVIIPEIDEIVKFYAPEFYALRSRTCFNFLGKRRSVKAIEILQSLSLLQNDKH